MAPKKKPSAQKALTSAGFWPLLPKLAVAIGKFVSVPGKFWEGCPSADKEKRFKCVVVDFIAVHDFGSGRKGSAFQLKEMGEDGRGSLEPGVASGEEFVLAYPLPFLEYYYYANRAELPDAVRMKIFSDSEAVHVAGSAAAASGDDAADDAEGGGGVVKQEKQERPPIFDFFEEMSSTLATAGPSRGKYTIKYKCTVLTSRGQCGGSATCYKTGDGKAETTSNAWTHLREKAPNCPAHAAALAQLNMTNRNVVQLEDGEFVKVMNFAEAFTHHVDYVWCRARGIFSANLGSKPLFRKYVRGFEPRAVFPPAPVLPPSLHHLQADGLAPPARGQHRAALLPLGRPLR